MPVVAFCLKIIWLIVLTRLLFLPLLLGLGFALAASALERHITSNPADGCAALGTKRAANYPDITGMGPVFSERTQLRVCPSRQ